MSFHLIFHFSMFVRPDTGMLVFNLFRSTHVADAYKCGKEIVVSTWDDMVEIIKSLRKKPKRKW